MPDPAQPSRPAIGPEEVLVGLGSLLVGVGASALWGWPWALLLVGGLWFVLGVLILLPPTTPARGV